MSGAIIAAVLVVIAVVRLRARRRKAATAPEAAYNLGPFNGDVALVAAREMRERFRSRIFRVGTLLVVAGVAAAILIPKLDHSPAEPERVGIVGPLSSGLQTTVDAAGKAVGTKIRVVRESGELVAERALRSGHIDVAVVNGAELIVNAPLSTESGSTDAAYVDKLSSELGLEAAVAKAHLSALQLSLLSHPKAAKVHSLQRARPSHASTKAEGAAQATSVIGLILIFIMLSQYNTWTLIGVMEEKSSRVIEVLLATVRPMQLLTGKVLGIGTVAFAQAAIIVGFALLLAHGVGSSLVSGTAPVVVVSTLVWLVLGYAFYCWVYAAAGSMAERQDQIQSLAFPLSLPMIFGYVVSLTGASSGNASVLVKVLAYLPPTAPFAMPVLVGLDAVSWWQFLASALICVAGTVAVARLATGIYRRAILRTGRRVQLREVLGRTVR